MRSVRKCMPRRLFSGTKDGLTLTETLVATAILGTTLCALITGFTMQQKAVKYANNRLEYMHSARAVMESLFAKGYYDSGLSVGGHAVSGGSYVITETNGVKNVALMMQWVDPASSKTQALTLASSIAQVIHK